MGEHGFVQNKEQAALVLRGSYRPSGNEIITLCVIYIDPADGRKTL